MDLKKDMDAYEDIIRGVIICLAMPALLFNVPVLLLWSIHTASTYVRLEWLGHKDRQNSPRYLPLTKGFLITPEGIKI